MENQKQKQKLINKIDEIKETLFDKLYKEQRVELNNLRNKLIFKDISRQELGRDIQAVIKLHDDLRWSCYTFNF